MSKMLTFDGTENKDDADRGEDYMKKFCESLREQPMKIIDFEKRDHDIGIV